MFLAAHRRELLPDAMFTDLFPTGRGAPDVACPYRRMRSRSALDHAVGPMEGRLQASCDVGHPTRLDVYGPGKIPGTLLSGHR
jgi:hypothetical protein